MQGTLLDQDPPQWIPILRELEEEGNLAIYQCKSVKWS